MRDISKAPKIETPQGKAKVVEKTNASPEWTRAIGGYGLRQQQLGVAGLLRSTSRSDRDAGGKDGKVGKDSSVSVSVERRGLPRR